ncbi:SRPBCC family protein [Paenibacillus methanolicus]|uniref:Uncharacterized protein YndB with AHSA1/START domain n=1 Tax=Paenibacillus methanolicus TaxID=582686 RepID=A0A5S5C8L5_9BACL|nr:SRPBCC family protein [Paenibacillus methanolicus]TYP74726.1 uncharacterized protein YndB with AHSA1/START domain [Paenibacillus methanolicus]
MTTFNADPVVKAEMLIRKPAEQVYGAFVDPDITTRFWFTKSSGKLEAGRHVTWEWEMYGASDRIYVEELEPNKRIRIASSDGTNVEWIFTARAEDQTYVVITNTGFAGTGDEIVNRAIDSMGGYTMVLCGLKALLEHNVELNLVADKAPDFHV